MSGRAHPVARTRQRGQVFLITVLLLVVGIGALIYSLVAPANRDIERDRKTAEALAQAKEALIGYATGQQSGALPANYRPGELPCPDTNDTGNDPGTCNTPGVRIGRLPWKTLGLPDPRDGSGERLWYAVSNVFKNATQTGVLNSDTPGDFTVNGTTPATNVIAVIFAPGAVVGNQNRDSSTTALCATTGATIARNLCAENYLEGGNQDGDAIFTTGLPAATFNDKLLLITSDNFFPAVTMRVARELQVILQFYFTSNNYYPFANRYSDPGPTYDCRPGELRGRIPNPGGSLFSSPCALSDTSWTFPPWYAANNWNDVVYYAVAPACTSPSAACSGAGGLLTVNGVAAPTTDKRAIVIVTGRAIGAQTRPCASVADCLEDPENNNADNTYVKNPLTAAVNDRLLVVAP